MPAPALPPVTRQEVEDFFFAEAALLDEWRLEAWLELLTDDATYDVPAPNAPDDDVSRNLALVYDDRERLEARVRQYTRGLVAPEEPRSRVRRIIGNVRILEAQGETLKVTANVVIYRLRGERVDTFVGRYDHHLVRHDGRLRIRGRRVTLDHPSLHGAGMLSIIL